MTTNKEPGKGTARGTSKISRNGTGKIGEKPPAKEGSKKGKGSGSSKFGGFIISIIKFVIFLALVGACYYGYHFYVDWEKNGRNTEKSLKNITNQATKDLAVAKENSKKYGTIALDKTTEWSAEAYKNSEEYLKTAKEFTKESFDELSAKIKEIGEKTPEELSSSADNYLKEFMSGKELDAPKVGEEVAYKSKSNDNKATDNKVEKPPLKEKSLPEQPAKIEEKPSDPIKEGFVAPEKLKTELKPPEITKEEPKKEEPKKKGFTKVGEKVGDINEDAIKKNEDVAKTQEIKKSEPVSEPPHMKIYKEGRGYFLEGLEHYKKQMPGKPNEQIHRRKAYALFKKAKGCFDKVESKMAGKHEEFDRIAVDNQRFMFGCGKSMTIDGH